MGLFRDLARTRASKKHDAALWGALEATRAARGSWLIWDLDGRLFDDCLRGSEALVGCFYAAAIGIVDGTEPVDLPSEVPERQLAEATLLPAEYMRPIAEKVASHLQTFEGAYRAVRYSMLVLAGEVMNRNLEGIDLEFNMGHIELALNAENDVERRYGETAKKGGLTEEVIIEHDYMVHLALEFVDAITVESFELLATNENAILIFAPCINFGRGIRAGMSPGEASAQFLTPKP